MLIEGKEMTTPISTTSTLNLNLSAVNAPLTELNRAEADTNKPLSAETQQALERFLPKQDDWYGLSPQVNKNKLSDFLAHPVKNLYTTITIGLASITGIVFALSLLAAKVQPQKYTSMELLKEGAELLFFIGLTTLIYINRQNLNKDTLQGIQTLGENASRQEWLDYKKTHPETAKE
jgi:hypothetical protein